MSIIFISQPMPNGHSWTITSKLGNMLRQAEEKYGQRDYSYTILGVEFNQEEHPRIWYPGDCKHIVIQITMNCINDLNRAVFQVAHEAIHCLSPQGKNSATVLEEGLASYFSSQYTLENGHGTWTCDKPKYREASNLVQKLLLIDPDIVKKIREVQPTISLIDKILILKTNPNIPIELADSLTLNFSE